MRLYFRKYKASEWKIYRSKDERGPVLQISFGRMGLTIRAKRVEKL